MSASNPYQIDWHAERTSVLEHIEGRGAVVRVVGGTDSAADSFVEIIRRQVKQSGFLTIRFDGRDETTRYGPDIIGKLKAMTELESPAELPTPTNTIDIGNDINAESLTLENITVHVSNGSAIGNDYKDVPRLCERLREILKQRRIMLI